MMGISWIELMVIDLIALIVIGPKDLPRALMTSARSLRAVRRAARDFQLQVDQFVRDSEIEALQRDVEDSVRDADSASKRAPRPAGEIVHAPPPAPAPEPVPASPETAASKDVAPKDVDQ
jgi:sec-independent protein translocase protein TatB